TALTVYLRNSEGKTAGEVFIYSLTKEESPGKTGPAEEDPEKEESGKPPEPPDKVQIENENTGEAPVESGNKLEPAAEGENPGEVPAGSESLNELPAEGEKVILAGAEGENPAIEKEAAAVSEKKPQQPQAYSYKDGNDIIIPVKDMDALPPLPLAKLSKGLPIGRYTLVFQVMSEKTSLYKTEKIFYYLGDADFSLKGISVHLPGIAEDTQLVPLDTVIMLEAKLNFDARLEPYFIWYNGKKIISEGSYADGGGNLLLKTPDQSGFFPVSVEVFPVVNRHGLTGFAQELSLPVSSKAAEMHLLSAAVPQLLNWYVFEGNLSDSKKAKRTAAEDKTLASADKIIPRWRPSGGTYGLVSGVNEAYALPAGSLPVDGSETRQFLFRFKPLGEGVIFNVQFGPSYDVTMTLGKEDGNLVLTLSTPRKTASQNFGLAGFEPEIFITACVDFSIWPGHLTAQLSVMGYAKEEEEPEAKPVVIAAALDGNFKTTLGIHLENKEQASDSHPEQITEIEVMERKPVLTALWDEFALLTMPPMEVEIPEEEPEDAAISS
ncbi:MAG: hypothetical protein LBU82_03935, partial [Treponema sp.]|nr:hypothetical protein [Treponema sp.]